ncbi:hypothetical protein HYH03_012383 [Edaphochlamys debaryana]|uniref:Erythromycin esterase n=1 Tax=Edaphochlamys debaryana TaxID=47281 RepID=A0A835XT23_9CHLO|nr:hypothetical protein HYH03_012383 [Edaphochlamys debaryana]|eukprot:KAG2489157.1 hypothetical protein HYH03_012383 [Edaphochlamys debaryana]
MGLAQLQHWARAQLLHDRVRVSPGPPSDLLRPDVNAVLQRRCSPVHPRRLRQAAEELGEGWGRRVLASTRDPRSAAQALTSELRPGEVREWLEDDITDLVGAYGQITGLPSASAKLQVLGDTPCPRFHADHVRLRALVSYAGPGTLVVDNRHVKRRWLWGGSGGVAVAEVAESAAQQAGEGDVVWLKGHGAAGNYGMGAVHRSPWLGQGAEGGAEGACGVGAEVEVGAGREGGGRGRAATAGATAVASAPPLRLLLTVDDVVGWAEEEGGEGCGCGKDHSHRPDESLQGAAAAPRPMSLPAAAARRAAAEAEVAAAEAVRSCRLLPAPPPPPSAPVPSPSPAARLAEALLPRIPPCARRSELTRLLIARRGFTAVLAEADAPDAARVNAFVRGLPRPRGRRGGGGRGEGGKAGGGERPPPDATAAQALGDFHRFPRWMWRNAEVERFVAWLRGHNAGVCPGEDSATSPRAAARRCGFYGLDLYSLHGSAEAVLSYLRESDPEAARAVEARYRCFDKYGADAQSYGLATSLFNRASCEEAVGRALAEVRRRLAEAGERAEGGPGWAEDALAAEANAIVVAGAEAYYRNMFTREEATWNLRDAHFLAAAGAVERHLRRGREAAGEADTRPRMVVWAHNSHLGDARATAMGWRRGELSLGQLLRGAYGRAGGWSGAEGEGAALLVGFSTHSGTVTAADDWGEPCRRKAVRPSRPGSWEHLMHLAAGGGVVGAEGGAEGGGPGARGRREGWFAVDLREPRLAEALQAPRLERAIGVVYRPDSELSSHYFGARLAEQFDLYVHVDHTRAVRPLAPHEGEGEGEGWGGRGPPPASPWEGGEEDEEAEGAWAAGVTEGDMPDLWPSGV